MTFAAVKEAGQDTRPLTRGGAELSHSDRGAIFFGACCSSPDVARLLETALPPWDSTDMRVALFGLVGLFVSSGLVACAPDSSTSDNLLPAPATASPGVLTATPLQPATNEQPATTEQPPSTQQPAAGTVPVPVAPSGGNEPRPDAQGPAGVGTAEGIPMGGGSPAIDAAAPSPAVLSGSTPNVADAGVGAPNPADAQTSTTPAQDAAAPSPTTDPTMGPAVPAPVEVRPEPNWPGRPSNFNGFDLYQFDVGDLNCRVAAPDIAAPGKPWVWRARFWGHKPGVDIALLRRGYHVAYVDVQNLFGSAAAIERFDAFYEFVTETNGLDRRVVLEGMSRGGLIVYNWAARNPEKVHCIYADAPVCDFKSWPGGLYNGTGNPSAWNSLLRAYEFTQQEAVAFEGNPIDNLQPLAEAGIPLMHVVGDADRTVPVAENTAVVEERYTAIGGSIQVIHKPNVGHVHGLADPTPIVEFVLRHSAASGR